MSKAKIDYFEGSIDDLKALNDEEFTKRFGSNPNRGLCLLDNCVLNFERIDVDRSAYVCPNCDCNYQSLTRERMIEDARVHERMLEGEKEELMALRVRTRQRRSVLSELLADSYLFFRDLKNKEIS